jgi:hypothetical protein
MNKKFTAKLLGATIIGTGLKNAKNPRVIIGSKLNGFLQGDILDANATDEFVAEKISEVVGAAPDMLDTLQELADALGGDANFATSVLEKIGDNKDEIAELKARLDRISMSVDGTNLILTF